MRCAISYNFFPAKNIDVLFPPGAPGNLVIRDNLGQSQRQGCSPSHPLSRGKAVLSPKYSPDRNPNEQVFAKLITLAGDRRTKANRRGKILFIRRKALNSRCRIIFGMAHWRALSVPHDGVGN